MSDETDRWHDSDIDMSRDYFPTAPSTPPTQPDRDTLARVIREAHLNAHVNRFTNGWATDAADAVLALLAAGTPEEES